MCSSSFCLLFVFAQIMGSSPDSWKLEATQERTHGPQLWPCYCLSKAKVAVHVLLQIATLFVLLAKSFVCILRQGLMYPKLFQISLCSSGWPWILVLPPLSSIYWNYRLAPTHPTLHIYFNWCARGRSTWKPLFLRMQKKKMFGQQLRHFSS